MDIFTAYGGLLVRFGIYQLIFWPVVGYYVARDATRRERPFPRLRGVVYGFFGIPGLLVYMAQRTRADADSA